ncbi:MAG: 4-hydroxythreonine-4-phosphate dehydrogenase PdxA [Spartobacteria bacterium]|nr:4-hydroxythreonine-4-phosphate dehydrogenase PdxA [Spartobacteria bacterium]
MKRIAITLGDINGIGPEVALKAVYKRRWPRDVQWVFIGSHAALSQQAEAFGAPAPALWAPEDAAPPKRKVVCMDPSPGRKVRWAPGKVNPEASRLAMAWIEEAVRGCMNGTFDGMVTAPICKEGLMAAGLPMPGHTEYLAELTGTKRFAMLLMGGPLRVVLVTRHIPLRRVADALTVDAIKEAIGLTAEALPWLGAAGGRIGVCGLNPHAGDGGAIGAEEIEVIAPAIQAMKRKRISIEGPVPPDVIFHYAYQGRYAAVVAMYHDQGLGPLKMLAFDSGINITLGLPIVRTSPDHGTAFDIAGTGRAHPSSMGAAMTWAIELSGRRNPWIRPR